MAKATKATGKKKTAPKTKAKTRLKTAGSKTAKGKKGSPPKKTAQAKTPKAARKGPPKPGSSVLWKFLEIKEQRRKEHAHEQTRPHGDYNPHQNDDGTHQRHSRFSRFAGPRRRAA